MGERRSLDVDLVDAVVNRVLALDAEGREAVAGLGDVAVRVHLDGLGREYVLRPAAEGVRVTGGAADPGHEHAGPSIRVSGPPLALLRMMSSLASGRAELPPDVRVSGDLSVLQELRAVVARMDPDWEEPLARLVGDAAAHAAGRAVRGFGAWARSAGLTLVDDVGEYLVEESRLAPGGTEVAAFAAHVERLRDDVERLEKRLERLERHPRRSAGA